LRQGGLSVRYGARLRHYWLAVRADDLHGRVLRVRARIGRFHVDDVAQKDLSLAELVSPDDDGLEGERALTERGDHRLAAGLDALGDGDFARAGKQLHRAHFAEIHAHRIVGAIGRLFGLGLGRNLLPHLDQLAAFGFGLLVGLFAVLLVVVSCLFMLDHVHAHLGEHRAPVRQRFDLVMGDVAVFLGDTDEPLDGRIRQVEQRQQGICGLSGPYRRRLVPFLFFLDRDFLGLARHACLLNRMPGDRATLLYAGRIRRAKRTDSFGKSYAEESERGSSYNAPTNVLPALWHRDETFSLGFFPRKLACSSDRFCLLASPTLGWLFVSSAKFHLANDPLALHLLFQNPKSLIDVVIANEYLHLRSIQIVAVRQHSYI